MIRLFFADLCPDSFPPPGLYHKLQCATDSSGKLSVNPGGLSDILQIVANVIQMLLSLSGIIAVIMIVLAGGMYVISQGDPAKTKKAKDMLTNAIIGLVIVSAAYAVVSFVSGVF